MTACTPPTRTTHPGSHADPPGRERYPEIEQLGGGSNSGLGTGGMFAKLTAAKIATGAGVDMVIANGANANVLYDIVDGKDVGDLSRYTFYDVTENHELYVDFAPISASRYEIEADCSYGGTITPSGTVHVSRDQDRTFCLTPVWIRGVCSLCGRQRTVLCHGEVYLPGYP